MHKRVDLLNSFGHLEMDIIWAGAGCNRGREGRHCGLFPMLYLIHDVDESIPCGRIIQSDGYATRAIEMRPGRIVFVPPGIEVDVSIASGTQIAAVIFRMSIVSEYELLASDVPCMYMDNEPDICKEIYSCFDHESEASEYLRALGLLIATCARLLGNARGEDFRRLVMLRTRYRPVLQALDELGVANVQVQHLAVRMNLDRSSFSRRFARDVGMSPKAYVTSILKKKTLESVLGTDKPFVEIAEELGFCDEYYFSKFFKRHFGQSPSTTREKHHTHHVV